MRYEKEFVDQTASRTDKLNRVVCIVGALMESLRYLVCCFSQRMGGRSVQDGYTRFYLIFLFIVACFWVLDCVSRDHIGFHYTVQFFGLTAGLVWACLFSVYQVKQGNTGTALPQVLLLTSAGLRSPGPLHLGVNIAIGLIYIAFLCAGGLSMQVLGREITDALIYLFISGVIIRATYHFQYESYCMGKKALEARNLQLDMMAEQMEQTRQMAQSALLVRHDMRHYAWEIQQGLERMDLKSIEEITQRFIERLDRTQGKQGIESYTGEPACDAILSNLAQWTDGEGIDLQLEMQLPHGISTQDLCLILMNALENAARAVSAQERGSERFIRLISNRVHGQYFFELTNTCRPGSVKFREKDGLPVSPREGHGFGTRSIAAILDRYGAVYRFRAEAGVFKFQFLLTEDGT